MTGTEAQVKFATSIQNKAKETFGQERAKLLRTYGPNYDKALLAKYDSKVEIVLGIQEAKFWLDSSSGGRVNLTAYNWFEKAQKAGLLAK